VIAFAPGELGRNDRLVKHGVLRIPESGMAHGARVALEDSLRLSHLPGEEEGRAYFFRRVVLRGLTVHSSRREWLERCEAVLMGWAQRAVHGADVRAGSADAVYFDSQQQAFEWQLARLLRDDLPTWFTLSICALPPHATKPAQLVGLIERLRSLAAGWFAAATAWMGAFTTDGSAALTLLAAVGESTLEQWLYTLHTSPAAPLRSIALSDPATRALEQALRVWPALALEPAPNEVTRARPHAQFGSELLFCAALALIAENPVEATRGTAMSHAREVLRALARRNALRASTPEGAITRVSEPSSEQGVATASAPARIASDPSHDAAARRPDELGVPCFEAEAARTEYAGLYFLLNVLARLGIARAEAACSAPEFVPELVRALARSAGVAKHDPILAGLARCATPEPGTADSAEVVQTVSAVACWPTSMLERPVWQTTSLEHMLRIWVVAARRFCLRSTGLTLRFIVRRPGRIQVTKTELDVTLPLDTVDLRLRRAGLDLDPGFVPWFGKVVRFRYAARFLDLPGTRDGVA
jgi:hypothetical protein